MTNVYTLYILLDMTVKVKKWGNGYGLLLPKIIMQKLQITENQILDFEFKNQDLIFRKKPQTEYNLEDLVSKITKKNLHKELDWGDDVESSSW